MVTRWLWPAMGLAFASALLFMTFPGVETTVSVEDLLQVNGDSVINGEWNEDAGIPGVDDLLGTDL